MEPRMPLARIRSLHPEALAVLVSKLLETGFEVEFARPGQILPDEADLEITAKAGDAQTGKILSWTTPYHAEPLAESSLEKEELNEDSVRELARIIAKGFRQEADSPLRMKAGERR